MMDEILGETKSVKVSAYGVHRLFAHCLITYYYVFLPTTCAAMFFSSNDSVYGPVIISHLENSTVYLTGRLPTLLLSRLA